MQSIVEKLYSDSDIDADYLATVHLANSAPNLLSALKKLLGAIDADYATCPDMTVRSSFETNRQAIALAREAIANAEYLPNLLK